MSTILSARGLTKVFDVSGSSVHALQGVDVDIESGEFVAIMGPSGCGKSTLLHLMAGMERPTAGEMILDGARVSGLSEAQWAVLRRKKIGFVFQSFNLLNNLSVAANVELPALLAGVKGKDAANKRRELLERLGIADKEHAVPSQLSGGQQQRVALARALVNAPEILMADEPTGNLDSKTRKGILDLLRQCNAAGQTIVLVTHDARVAAVARRRILHMRDGRVTDETRTDGRRDVKGILGSMIAQEA
ncbi:MAG: ABC transporter ATP-binding protein [SAR202 cluster bacterium]|nr:ABC transporter ATP-binding protein [SAR202 cluster bacterium]